MIIQCNGLGVTVQAVLSGVAFLTRLTPLGLCYKGKDGSASPLQRRNPGCFEYVGGGGWARRYIAKGVVPAAWGGVEGLRVAFRLRADVSGGTRPA